MSLITYRHREHAKPQDVSDAIDPRQITSLRLIAWRVIADPLRGAIASGARLIARALQAIAEARMQRAMMEAELYHGRYRLSSKNDDDLPIVR